MSAAKAFSLLLAASLVPASAIAAQATPAVPTGQAAPPAADAPVRAAVTEFVGALNALDAERLGRTMAEDVTVFFPGPPFPAARIQGRATVQNAFGQLFGALRQRGTRTASLSPTGLAVQLYGDTAIATFHLMGAQDVGRRTLVLRRSGVRWLVVHMHGSVAPMQQRPAATPAPAAPARPAPTPAPPQRR